VAEVVAPESVVPEWAVPVRAGRESAVAEPVASALVTAVALAEEQVPALVAVREPARGFAART
jgi:hypothetical protein